MEKTILYIVVILLLGVVVWLVASHYASGSETFEDKQGVNAIGVAPSEPSGNEIFSPVKETDDLADGNDAITPDCFPRDRLTSQDLLPQDAANSKWAQANPAGQGDVANINLLDAGHHYGIDTQGSSLRNANKQLRSDPVVSQSIVSPWNNTTISPDLSRRPLE